MPWRKVGAAVVVVAHQFNPSIVNQLWLVKHGLVGEEDFLPKLLFSDVIVQAPTRQFTLLVLPDQLQFFPKVSEEEEQSLILEKVGTIVQTLPHTPFRALGLNFNWQFLPKDEDVTQLTRKLFCQENRPLDRLFDQADSRFGGYFSKDILGFRLKLDVKPILVETENEPEDVIQFSFNFHADLSNQEPVKQIEKLLGRWNEVKKEVKLIIEAVELGGET